VAAALHGDTPYSGKTVTSGSATPYTTSVDVNSRGCGLPTECSATPGYLTDPELSQLPNDWLTDALAYTSALCKGIPGPLTSIRTRSIRSTTPPPQGETYKLADYLDNMADLPGTTRSHREPSGPQQPATPTPASSLRSAMPP
jgi:hypothetical protein